MVLSQNDWRGSNLSGDDSAWRRGLKGKQGDRRTAGQCLAICRRASSLRLAPGGDCPEHFPRLVPLNPGDPPRPSPPSRNRRGADCDTRGRVCSPKGRGGIAGSHFARGGSWDGWLNSGVRRSGSGTSAFSSSEQPANRRTKRTGGSTLHNGSGRRSVDCCRRQFRSQ